MALETTLVFETSPPIPMTCADGTGIEKGAVLMLADLMTAATATGDGDIVAGIAAEEKVVSDGKVKIGVYRRGIFKGYAGAAGVTVGRAIQTDVGTGAANELVICDANTEAIVGTALETATDGETFLFELNPIAPVLA